MYLFSRYILCILLLAGGGVRLCAQQVVVTDDDDYHSVLPHTLFEFYASNRDKGVLLPRLQSDDRKQLSPQLEEEALLVYDLDTKSFWYWRGTDWEEIKNEDPDLPDSTRLTDGDRDTRITVEHHPDEDIVRIWVGGTEKWRLDKAGRLQLTGSLQLNGGPEIRHIQGDSTWVADDSSLLTAQAIQYQLNRLDHRIDTLDGGDSLYLRDTDGDTRIFLEKIADEDHIRFETQGQERMALDPNGLIHLYGTLHLNNGEGIREIRSDTTLLLSDTTLVTEATVKRYVDHRIDQLPPPPSVGGTSLYVNVADYGIIGDTTTDYSDTLNSLIANHPEATLFFPDGVYIANLEINHPIILVSFSEQVEIRAAQSGQPVIAVKAPCKLKGLRFVHLSTAAGSDGLRNLGHDIEASHCRFVGYEHDATHHASVSRFDHCTFTTTAMSLGTLAWSPSAVFSACTFDGEFGADVQDSKFYQCTFRARWGVHMPEGAIDNQGNPSGFSGVAEFHDCILIGTANYAIGLGNRAKAILYNCRLTGYDAGAYARSESTFEMYNCSVACIRGGGTASALFFSKYIKPDKAAIGLIDSGDSYFSNCSFVNPGGGTQIVVPNKTNAGLAKFSQCSFDITRVCTEDTLGFCQGDIYGYLQFETGQHIAPVQTLRLSHNEFLVPPITEAQKAYLDIMGDAGSVVGIMLAKLDQQGREYPTGFQVILRCGSNTHTVTLKNGYNPSKGVGLFTASGRDLKLTQNAVAVFTYTKSIWVQTSPNGAVFSDAAGDVSLSGRLAFTQGSSVNEFSTDATLSGNSDAAVPTERAIKTYVENQIQLFSQADIQTNGVISFRVPPGFRLVSLVIEETAGQTAGAVQIGTSLNGDEVVSAVNIGGNQLEDCPLQQKLFSLSQAQTLYVSSDNWGSGRISVHTRMERIK